jgi:hypothetical protein
MFPQLATARYTLQLWDHDVDDDGSGRCGWSDELARRHLDGPNQGLDWRALGEGIRRLYSFGWSDMTIWAGRDEFAMETVKPRKMPGSAGA